MNQHDQTTEYWSTVQMKYSILSAAQSDFSFIIGCRQMKTFSMVDVRNVLPADDKRYAALDPQRMRMMSRASSSSPSISLSFRRFYLPLNFNAKHASVSWTGMYCMFACVYFLCVCSCYYFCIHSRSIWTPKDSSHLISFLNHWH